MKRLAYVLMLAVAGCGQKPENFRDTLTFLQEGQAQGHLTITSDGRLSGGWNTQFGIGPEKSALSFDGDIDFGGRMRHVTTGGPIPLTADPDTTPDLTVPNADDE